jgi:hypothetical protein
MQLKEYAPYLMSVLLFFMSLSAPTDMQLIIIFNSVKRKGKEKRITARRREIYERGSARENASARFLFFEI